MSDWTCVENCAPVTWDHVETQVLIAAVPWALLSAGGCAFSCYLPNDAGGNWRQRFVIYEYGLSSSSSGATVAVIFVHLIQCTAFAIRSARRGVDSIYFGLEVLGTLFVCLDVLASWSFVVTNGLTKVVKSSFGWLVLDCLVLTSVIGVATEHPQKGRTWFSFSYLGALRLVRILDYLVQDNVFNIRRSSGWRRQVLYHVLQLSLVIYALAATIMVLEVIGTPRAPSEGWELGPSLFFAVSTLLTLGDATLAPKTIFGRLCTIGLTIWSCLHIASKVYPVVKDHLLDTNLGRESYKQSWWHRAGGHVVICGNPTARMLMEFFEEMYHENHFDGDESFDQLAPDCVTLIPDARTLSQVRMLLKRRSCLRFRDRILLLHGEVFNAIDAERAELQKARRIFVLPDLGTLDVVGNDRQNIMRTFALCRGSPHVDVICLLHKSDFNPATLSVGNGKSTFLCIEDVKLCLLGMASLTRGALSLVCNMCRTVGGDSDLENLAPWQCDYERSVGIELYQVPLAVSYDGCTFSQVAADINERSENRDVYLIGIIEQDNDLEPARVTMHPGALHVLELAGGGVSGVFMSPDLSAIVQADDPVDKLGMGAGASAAEQPLAAAARSGRASEASSATYRSSRRLRTRGPPALDDAPINSQALGAPELAENSQALVPFADSSPGDQLRAAAGPSDSQGAPFGLDSLGITDTPKPPTTAGVAAARHGKASDGKAAKSAIEQAVVQREVELTRRAEAEAKLKEATAMDSGKIAAARKALEEKREKEMVHQYAVDGYEKAMRDIRGRLLVAGLHADVVAGVTIPEEALNKGKVAMDFNETSGSGWWPSDQNLVGITAISTPFHRQTASGGFKRPELSNQWALPNEGEPDPVLVNLRRLDNVRKKVEAAMVAAEAAPPPHVLRSGGHMLLCVVGGTTDSSELVGREPRAGVGPKLYQFLVPLVDGRKKGFRVKQAIVILSEEVPGDWNRILELDRVYHIRGSALCLSDLQSAAFQKASAISIVRAHGATHGTVGKVSDARVLLACNLVEANMPKLSPCLVITDHAFQGSCEFLPAVKVPIERPPVSEETPFFGDMLEAFRGALNSARARPADDSVALRPPKCQEDFEELGSSNFTYHPRYMKGQVFVSSVMTTLVASTLYNPSVLLLVDALMRAPLLLLPIPVEFTMRSYGDFFSWLMSDRNILALGLYRSAAAAEADQLGKPVDESKPTHHYVYTAPPANSTRLIKTDLVICIAPSRPKPAAKS